LYYMNQGMVLHMAQKYAESNALMEQAKTAAQELWTESIGSNAAAWLSTDNSLPYNGEDFERVLLHFVSALNYTGLRNFADARVEARQITQALDLYNAKYGASAGVYRDDAFARWLSGRLAETDAQDMQANSDAWIEYKAALAVYETQYGPRYGTRTPALLLADAQRVLQRLGPDFASDLQALRARHPQLTATPEAGMGRVVFVHLNGEAPIKQDRFWTAQAGREMIRVAYPEFVQRPHAIGYARVAVRGTPVVATTEVMEDISAIAVQNLRDHMGRIQAKAIARQVAKHIAGSAAEVAGNRIGGTAGGLIALSGAVFKAVSTVTEEADKRSWTLLPANVAVSEVLVPPGAFTLDVDFIGPGGAVIEHAEMPARVEAGGSVFLSYRTFQ
jgi:hypothetical protein